MPRRYRDTTDLAAGTRRIIRALGSRLAQEDPRDLLALSQVQQSLDQAWAAAVAGLRKSDYSDGEIGRVLGITKQAVQQRWPRESG